MLCGWKTGFSQIPRFAHTKPAASGLAAVTGPVTVTCPLRSVCANERVAVHTSDTAAS